MGFPSSSLVRTTECVPDDGREMEYAFHTPTPALNSPLRDAKFANKMRSMRSSIALITNRRHRLYSYYMRALSVARDSDLREHWRI